MWQVTTLFLGCAWIKELLWLHTLWEIFSLTTDIDNNMNIPVCDDCCLSLVSLLHSCFILKYPETRGEQNLYFWLQLFAVCVFGLPLPVVLFYLSAEVLQLKVRQVVSKILFGFLHQLRILFFFKLKSHSKLSCRSKTGCISFERFSPWH